MPLTRTDILRLGALGIAAFLEATDGPRARHSREPVTCVADGLLEWLTKPGPVATVSIRMTNVTKKHAPTRKAP